MNSVHILWHVRKDDEYGDDAKLIGVYGTHADAEAAIERLADKPGFKDYREGFQVLEYQLNKDHWTEGFISWKEASSAEEVGELKKPK